MKVIPGTDGWPEGYEYTVGGNVRALLDEPSQACARSCTRGCFIPPTITTA